jgi:hypothetical protein
VCQLRVVVERDPGALDAEAIELIARGAQAGREGGAGQARRAMEGIDDREQGVLLRARSF